MPENSWPYETFCCGWSYDKQLVLLPLRAHVRVKYFSRTKIGLANFIHLSKSVKKNSSSWSLTLIGRAFNGGSALLYDSILIHNISFYIILARPVLDRQECQCECYARSSYCCSPKHSLKWKVLNKRSSQAVSDLNELELVSNWRWSLGTLGIEGT